MIRALMFRFRASWGRPFLGTCNDVDGSDVTEFEIAGGPKAPLSARAKLSEKFDDRLGGPVVDNMRLLVSELVTNCVVHGGASADGAIRIRARVDDVCVHTEVCHDGPRFVAPSSDDPDLTEPGGLGLFLVEQMSSAWGIEEASETCVWFELCLETA